MISLADLRARNVTPSWHEAVAVVQELLQSVVTANGSAERLPDLEHVALIANGDVVALPGSPAAGHPVRHLSIILRLLLDGSDAPGELTALIDRNVADPPHLNTVEEFTKELAFFERPGRRGDIERLVSRALAAEAQTRADEELRRLKERAVEAAARPELDATLANERPHHGHRTAMFAGLAAGLVAVAIGAWFWRDDLMGRSASAKTQARVGTTSSVPGGQTQTGQTQLGQTPSGVPQSETGGQTPLGQVANDGTTGQTPPGQVGQNGTGGQTQTGQTQVGQTPDEPSLLARAASTVGGALRSAVDKVLGPRGEPAPAAAVQVPVEEPKRKAARGSRPRNGNGTPSATPTPATGLPTSAVFEDRTSVTTDEVTAPPESVAAVATDTAEAIYSSTDPSVQPPVLVRPLLPATPPPGVPPDQVGTLELLIDQQGSVEQVKLTSPSNRYQERMLVAHAKSWKFRPAMRDGHPVRYRTRVRLTI